MVGEASMQFVWYSFFLFLIGIEKKMTNAYVIDNTPGLERQFDGIGAISGGGATSKLLVNYPEQQRNEILDYLFKPNFGASLHILKVEIGGDAQSTDGTESSHRHNFWDENYKRGYEWWLMVEAKKRNPQIKLYGLPWAFPGWISNYNTTNPYVNPNITANYTISWITGAKKYYNLDIDYIGGWNEKPYSLDYYVTLRRMLDKNNLTSVRIVGADGNKKIFTNMASDVLSNATVAKAVDYLGIHYPGTVVSPEGLKTGKQLWASEDYSTLNDDVGAGCWVRILNQNYVNGYMTSALPYPHSGLMSAVEPWSGNYIVSNPIWMTAHTTQFVQIGWHYLKHGYGVGKLDQGGSYVSLLSPDGKDFTLIVETMSYNHSKCIRPSLTPYTVKPQTAVFTFQGALASIKQLYGWYSQLNFSGGADVVFKKMDPVPIKGAQLTVSLGADAVYTFSTISTATKGSYAAPPASKPFPLPYKDDFEGYVPPAEPYLFAPQVGVFEVSPFADDPQHTQVMEQVMLHEAAYWCVPTTTPRPITLGGDYTWGNVSVQVEVYFPFVVVAKGAFVAARVSEGGCSVKDSVGIFFFVFPANSSFMVTADLEAKTILIQGSLSILYDTWNLFTLTVTGKTATGVVNKLKMFDITLPQLVPNNGFVGVGTEDYGRVFFDNLVIANSSQGLHEVTNEN